MDDQSMAYMGFWVAYLLRGGTLRREVGIWLYFWIDRSLKL